MFTFQERAGDFKFTGEVRVSERDISFVALKELRRKHI
jgi:hypothetical protein